MNVFNIESAYKRMSAQGWDKIFWAVDLHGTIIRPNYQDSSHFDFYPGALEVLRWLSESKEDSLLLYTCSHPEEIEKVLNHFKDYGVLFDYANVNPEAGNTVYGNYEHKLYFNVLLEDKAGFDPDNDWYLIRRELDRLGKWPL